MRTARITIDLALPEGLDVDQRVLDGLDGLANVMLVQAEDGLYTSGSPDWPEDTEFICHWGAFPNRRNFSASVEVVDDQPPLEIRAALDKEEDQS